MLKCAPLGFAWTRPRLAPAAQETKMGSTQLYHARPCAIHCRYSALLYLTEIRDASSTVYARNREV